MVVLAHTAVAEPKPEPEGTENLALVCTLAQPEPVGYKQAREPVPCAVSGA